MTKQSKPAAVPPGAVRTRRAYFDCRYGQLHVRTAFPATTPPNVARSQASATERTPAVLDRCGALMQTLLRLTKPANRWGVATIGGQSALVYEFSGPSFKTGKATTIVAAVGPQACNPIVTFER